MSVAKQLYRLQELDLEIESNEQALKKVTSQIGESAEVAKVRQQLEKEQKRLEELRHQQHAAEWEIDDVVTKLSAAEETLFSGRVKNPKELTNLQHEVDMLKTQRDHLEEKALEVIERVEQSEASLAKISAQLETLTAEWQSQQKQLSEEKVRLESALAELKKKRQMLVGEIEPQAVEFYQGLKEDKGTAVAKVEQGICRGCRISLPTTELQQARGGNLVQCSSCGRILFLA
jgi:predicted  nucleic acid-binding Zn-ribbon protein